VELEVKMGVELRDEAVVGKLDMGSRSRAEGG
jgi:hypothetical protein